METYNYSELLEKLTMLTLKEKDPDRKEKLRKVHSHLSEKIERLIELNLENDDEKYKSVFNALELAEKSLKDYSRDTKKITQTLSVLSEVVKVINEFV